MYILVIILAVACGMSIPAAIRADRADRAAQGESQ